MTEFIRLQVAAGSPEGANSTYVLPDRGVVIDPGPPSESAWRGLVDGLERATVTLGDIEYVFVTHWHVDHAGLAPRLADAADATVVMHEDDAPLVGDYETERCRRLDRDERTLTTWGVPEPVRRSYVDGDAPSPLPETYPVRRAVDGESIAGLELVHTPGHTSGHASFALDDALFLGDVLLPTYTPNVGGSDTRLQDPLAQYLESVTRLDAMSTTGEPGHGTTVDVSALAESVIAHHGERARRTFRVLAETAPSTPWTVARRLFGSLCGIHVKFGTGEAAAHLRRLAALGMFERIDGEEEPERYRPCVDRLPSDLRLAP